MTSYDGSNDHKSVNDTSNGNYNDNDNSNDVMVICVLICVLSRSISLYVCIYIYIYTYTYIERDIHTCTCHTSHQRFGATNTHQISQTHRHESPLDKSSTNPLGK